MRYQRGYIAITAVLVLSALFLSVSISVASRGITANDTSLASHTSTKARYAAESCIEYGLMRIQDSLAYAGGESVPVGENVCVLMPILGTGIGSRTLHAYSMIDGYTYRVEAVVSVTGSSLQLSSFERVSTF